MASNGLTFERRCANPEDDPMRQRATEGGWQLRPDLHEASTFGELERPNAPAGVTCQLLAREVAMAAVRERDARRAARDVVESALCDDPDQPSTAALATAAQPSGAHADAAAPVPPRGTFKQRKTAADLLAAAAAAKLAPKASDASNKRKAFSFAQWGATGPANKRPTQPKAARQQHPAPADPNADPNHPTDPAVAAPRRPRHAERSNVTFKFQKGFTNAVRRPVYIKDLLN